ncbi:SDR family oxidoreductase [Shinella daejeonensis]|uniref:SDR family oxidoreductase n=1 Tax=Shinella daejeonensis TaxID=659017 RepID=UPI0020C7CC21|nr:SDR family oxidoreductase [Shinella daejeonensis]
MSAPLIVMITAAASGIGRTVAEAFATAGHRVFACDADARAVEEMSASNPTIAASRVDVTSPAEIEAWFASVKAEAGGLDVLINNAGIAGPTDRLENIAVERWQQCIDVCLNSQFLTGRCAIPLMKERGSGSIINLSSTAGLFGYGLRTPYAAAKWAVIGLTKSMAIELGDWNIRVNAICPGSVSGDRMDRVIAAEASMRATSAEEIRRGYTSGQSIKRFVEPREIADLCLFLSSPAASMISGQAIAIDGHTETYHL